MPITVRCPNETCAKSFRLPVPAAGKTGKCPACGARIIIPGPNPAAAPTSKSAGTTAPASARSGPRRAVSAPSPTPHARTSIAPAAIDDAVIRFEAIGEAWGFFREEIGVWILASLIVTFACAILQFAFFLISIPMSIVGGAFLSGGLSLSTSFGSLAVSMAVWGVFLGGMCRMALKQIDGHSIRLNDLVSGTDILPSLALAWMLAVLAGFAGFLCLVIPGWIISGILMFSLPLVADRRLKAVDALRVSWTTLKDQWLPAAVFALVLWVLQIVGMLFCGMGYLVTLPLSVLSQAILYRGFFPRGGARAKPALVVDPDFGPVAIAARPKGRIPGWAWLVAVAGLLAPAVVLGLVIALMAGLVWSASRGFHENDKAFQQAVRNFEERGQEIAQGPGPPAIPEAEKVLGPNLGVPEGPRIDDVTETLAEWEKRLEARDATSPFKHQPGADLGEEMRKFMERQRAAANVRAEMQKQEFMDSRRPRSGVKPADIRKGPGGTNRIDVAPLVADLTNENVGVQRGALERLARFAPNPLDHDEVIKALEPVMGDPQATLRAAAVKVLAVWANEEDVSALIRSLDDKDPGVCRQALVAFGRIKDELRCRTRGPASGGSRCRGP